jgi:signal transduction histidine kinase
MKSKNSLAISDEASGPLLRARSATLGSVERWKFAGLSKIFTSLRSLIPTGGTLPKEIWLQRHRFLVGLTWFHAIIIALLGPLLGYTWEFSFDALSKDGTIPHILLESSIIALFAALASWRRIGPTLKAILVALGLTTSSAIFVHLSGGYIELHFHFFVMIVFLAFYQDWIPFGVAITYVALHHGFVGVLWPQKVYNHPAAFESPWTWAGIHAFFVLWAAAGSLIAWRYNEKAYALAETSAKETELALERIRALYEINVAVTSTLDLSATLNILAEKINNLLTYSAVQIWLANDRTGVIERAACWNMDEAEWKRRKLSDTPALIKEAMANTRPVMAQNVQADPRILDREFYRKQGFVSYLGAPLLVGGEVLGVLVCLTKEERHFAAHDIQFLSVVASQAAVAIQNAQLYEKTRDQAVALEKSNRSKDELLQVMARQKEELSRLNAGLEIEIAERSRARAEITAKNRDLETLLYVTSHDLREPLRAIENFSRIVHDRYKDRLDEKGQDFLRRVIQGAQRLNHLLDDILALSRSQRIGPPAEVVDGEIIVLEALKRLDAKISTTNAQIRVAKDFDGLRVDRTWATQAVYNLIANALKFTRDGDSPDVEIEPYRPNGSGSNVVGVAVRDRGPGVPQEHAERIFQLFQRAVGREVEGTGAGLAIVRQIAERHGGNAWVEQRQGGGSEFIITFSRS